MERRKSALRPTLPRFIIPDHLHRFKFSTIPFPTVLHSSATDVHEPLVNILLVLLLR